MATAGEKALTFIPKVGASLSIPSSLFIIFEAISDHRRGRGTAIQRALVGMSVVDVLASVAWWLSTWAVPKESGAYLAAGNEATCNFQGFLLQLAVGSPLYNCSLALYYVLVINYNWSNEQLIHIERFVHTTIITFTIGTSIAGLPTTMYNKVGTVCWVIGSPADCGNSSATPSDIPCDRGDWAWVFGIALFYGPLWLCVFFTVVSMTVIYSKVRKTFKKTDENYGSAHIRNVARESAQTDDSGKFSLGARFVRFSLARDTIAESSTVDVLRRSSECSQTSLGATSERPTNTYRTRKKREKLTQFATQAILYSGSFFITWMPSTIWSVAHWFGLASYSLDLLAAICEPLQGFWNMLIFIRRRPASRRKINNMLSKIFCCCTGIRLLISDSSDIKSSDPAGNSGDSTQSERGVNGSSRKFTLHDRDILSNEPSKRSLDFFPNTIHEATTHPISGVPMSSSVFSDDKEPSQSQSETTVKRNNTDIVNGDSHSEVTTMKEKIEETSEKE